MEGVSVTVYNGLKRYWTNRSYRKLAGPVSSGRRETVRLGAAGGRRRRGRRVWRIKIPLKLSLLRRLPSVKKLLLWPRDSYVKAMVAFSKSRVAGAGGGTGDGVWDGGERRTLKEYDEKMITEIYKSLVVAQGQLTPPESVRPRWGGGRLAAVAE